MRQAIVTKYLSPTNYRGSRVKATCEAGSVTIGWSSASSTEENHKEAILTLLAKIGWIGPDWHYGWLGNAMVAVNGD